MRSHRPALIVAMLFLAGAAFGDNGKADQQHITSAQRIDIIRSLNGEMVFARKPFPLGTRGLEITPDGRLIPDGMDLEKLVAVTGPAVKVGERARITDLIIKDKMIIFEINGGPVKKKKWYDRIQIGGAGGSTTVTPQPDETARGSYIAVTFDKFVPQLTPEELKQKVAAVLDFHAKSTEEAFMDTLSPKVKAAVKNHQVLVGMNKDMVLASIGKPPRKTRETEDGIDYEEWIYGDPPQEVKFVRFVGDEVKRLEIMTIDGQKIVRNEREIDAQPTVAKTTGPEEKPVNAPTLKRPGEKADIPPPRPKDAPTQKPGQPIPQPGDGPIGGPPVDNPRNPGPPIEASARISFPEVPCACTVSPPSCYLPVSPSLRPRRLPRLRPAVRTASRSSNSSTCSACATR